MRGKCESCEFFDPCSITVLYDGSCHIRSVSKTESWPLRCKDDWCGEHQEKEEEDNHDIETLRRLGIKVGN